MTDKITKALTADAEASVQNRSARLVANRLGQLPKLTKPEVTDRLEQLVKARLGQVRAYRGGDPDVEAGLLDTAHTYREALRLLGGK